jgi:hypothetical protein
MRAALALMACTACVVPRSDSAVAGEAAGISLGLLCCSTGGERVAAEALAYAHDTQHEKIIRGAGRVMTHARAPGPADLP